MTVTPTREDAADLVADIRALIALVQAPAPLWSSPPRESLSDRPRWGRCRSDWLPFGHDELAHLIGLAESVAYSAEELGLDHFLRSIGPGYGADNLPLPMDDLLDPEKGDGGGVVFLPSRFTAWRAAMDNLLSAALEMQRELARCPGEAVPTNPTQDRIRTGPAAEETVPPCEPKRRIPKKEAEILVRDFLKNWRQDNGNFNEVTVIAVNKGTGVSCGQIPKLTAWRVMQDDREQRHERTLSEFRSLTPEMLAVRSDPTAPNPVQLAIAKEKEEKELAELIREQAEDLAEDERAARRSQRSRRRS